MVAQMLKLINILILYIYTLLLWHWTSSAGAKNFSTESRQMSKASSIVYTASWAIQLQNSANDSDVFYITNILGLKYKKILPNNYYLLTDEHNQHQWHDKPDEKVTEALKSFPEVIWVEQQEAEYFDFRSTFSDALWNEQFYLESNTGYNVSQRVEDVWEAGYTGKSVTVVVVDDGVRGTHQELRNRYDVDVSVILAHGPGQSGAHGTQCAGVIAAEANGAGLCGVGVAYDCQIAGVQIFNDNKSATDAQKAQALYREDINPTKADIFSNSWGPKDDGYTISGPGRLTTEAFKHGIKKGRNGLGSIYVFSCGNGKHIEDSCAFDGYVNSIYTIAVSSVTRIGKTTGFSEPCSAIMTAVFSSDMVTLSNEDDNGCVKDFGRTSAAAAFVSGILALALEANPNLTWRDMQHLIARSSRWDDVDVSVKRFTNAKKYTVNEYFGFGVLDAFSLVNNAKNWNVSVPEQVKCILNVTEELGTQAIPSTLDVHITEDNLNCDESKMINSLEHVQLTVDLVYTNRAVLTIDVKSHSRTFSRFVYPRKYDSIDDPTSYNNLVVTSVHFWGETLLGTWSVDIRERGGEHKIGGAGTLLNMSLIFYGTTEVLKDNENNYTFNGNDNESNGNDNTSDDDLNSNKGAIIGGVVAGAIVVIVLIAVVVYILKRRPPRRSSDELEAKQEIPNNDIASAASKVIV